ncbi:MAG: hypothetical protein FWH29_09725 [Methanobrevibacter sp.]|nr:hypothetical protein [Methanobrevibacter sp.]
MKNVEKQFLGIFLVVLGAFVSYLSFFYHLIEIFIIFGVILFIIGLYFLFVVFLDKSKAKKSKGHKPVNPLSNDKKVLKTNSNKVKSNKANSNKVKSNKHPHKIKKGGNKIINKVKKVQKTKNPNEVLKKPNSNVKDTSKTFEFTPNYERPVKVSRKPIKKSDLVDVSNVPDISKIPKVNKSKEIFEALAHDDFIEPEHNVGNNKIPCIKAPDSQSPNSNSSKVDNEANPQDTISFDNMKSFVLTPDGAASSKQVSEQLISNAKTEILIETPSIKDVNEFLSSKDLDFNVRIIIQEFDIKDQSIISLVQPFIEKGVLIKVLPFVNTTNLIVDGKSALIISKNKTEEELEVGALYDEMKEIVEIRDTFEKSWELANDFDIPT